MRSLHSEQITREHGSCTSLQSEQSTNNSHCHIDWHVVAGMVAQFIEAPFEMQKRLHVPDQIGRQCQAAGISISGPNV